MSEFISNREKRVANLLAFSLGIMNGENGKQLMDKYHSAIAHITPHDMLEMEDQQMKQNIPPAKIKKYIDKVINVFYKYLDQYPWEKPAKNTFLYYLMQENEALINKLTAIKKILKQFQGRTESDFDQLRQVFTQPFQELLEFDSHYLKKENILFPVLEKKWKNHRPLQVMWSLHDDIRQTLKDINTVLANPASVWADLNQLLGRYFFLAMGMIQKENLVVFPIAIETVTAEEWATMLAHSYEFGFAFISGPNPGSVAAATRSHVMKDETVSSGTPTFNTSTGSLTLDQLVLMLNKLPLDITYVDADDRVTYFSNPADRFFPRSPAIIGRAVQNCHPPESVHIVEKIINSFKKGIRDDARFWIQMRGKFVLIQYFALRDKTGIYQGVLEVSQDITDIRKLEGEQRLLDWTE